MSSLFPNFSRVHGSCAEQGRQVSPSPEVLEAISRALLLDEAETDYLTNLARPVTGAKIKDPGLPAVRPGVVKMMQNFQLQPAFVLGPRMEVLAGNELAWALLADFPARDSKDRNLLRWVLTSPEAKELYIDWSDIVQDLIGVLQY